MASFQCLSSSNGDLIAARAAADAAALSDPVQTDTVVATGGATGVADTLRFPIPEPNKPSDTGRLVLVGSVAWEITVAGGAAATGRVNLVLLRNGTVVPDATFQNGATQALDAIAGPFRDTLRCFAPSLRLDADDTLEIGVQLEVVAAGAAGNATVRVHHNPAVLADSFPVELPQVGEATVGHEALMTDAGAEGVVEPAASAQTFSAPVQTDTVIATDGAPGVVATVEFNCRPRRPFRDERVDILALIRTEITAAGGAGATGRVNLTATLNNAAIAGVTPVNGNTISLAAIAGPFNDLLHLVIPELSMDLDDVLQISVQVELVAAGAAGNATHRLHHNPAAAGDELFIEAIDLD